MSLFSDLGSLKWGDWFYTLLSAGIGAAATTLAANPIANLAGAPDFTPRQLIILACSSAVVAMAGVLRKSPLPDRAVAIALLQGVHTPAQVEQIASATAPGVVPSAAVAAAILATPPPTASSTTGATGATPPLAP